MMDVTDELMLDDLADVANDSTWGAASTTAAAPAVAAAVQQQQEQPAKQLAGHPCIICGVLDVRSMPVYHGDKVVRVPTCRKHYDWGRRHRHHGKCRNGHITKRCAAVVSKLHERGLECIMDDKVAKASDDAAGVMDFESACASFPLVARTAPAAYTGPPLAFGGYSASDVAVPAATAGVAPSSPISTATATASMASSVAGSSLGETITAFDLGDLEDPELDEDVLLAIGMDDVDMMLDAEGGSVVFPDTVGGASPMAASSYSAAAVAPVQPAVIVPAANTTAAAAAAAAAVIPATPAIAAAGAGVGAGAGAMTPTQSQPQSDAGQGTSVDWNMAMQQARDRATEMLHTGLDPTTFGGLFQGILAQNIMLQERLRAYEEELAALRTKGGPTHVDLSTMVSAVPRLTYQDEHDVMVSALWVEQASAYVVPSGATCCLQVSVHKQHRNDKLGKLAFFASVTRNAETLRNPMAGVITNPKGDGFMPVTVVGSRLSTSCSDEFAAPKCHGNKPRLFQVRAILGLHDTLQAGITAQSFKEPSFLGQCLRVLALPMATAS